MPLTRSEKKELRYKKGRYRSVFSTSLGKWVLGDMLFGPCRFGMPAIDQDTATRQAVGKEFLCLMDLWAGEGQSTRPEVFVAKLTRGIEKEHKPKRKERK